MPPHSTPAVLPDGQNSWGVDAVVAAAVSRQLVLPGGYRPPDPPPCFRMDCVPVFPGSQVPKMDCVPVFPGSQVPQMDCVSVFSGSQVFRMDRVYKDFIQF